MLRAPAVIVVALLMLVSAPLAAHADGAKGFVNGSPPAANPSQPFQGFNPQGFRGFNPHGFSGFNPPAVPPGSVVVPHRPHHPVFVAPSPVFVFRSAPYSCWAPGYWAYQWIPQAQAYNAWAPGQWAPDGTWIGGHYETQVYSSGYYQPVWISERWVC